MHDETAQTELKADFSAADMRAFAPFSVYRPAAGRAVPFLFNAPHAGRNYARSFMAQTQLDRHTVRASEDCYTDALFSGAPALGAVLMTAHFPRCFVDVNRPAFALDKAMFSGLDNRIRAKLEAETHSPYVRAGFGSVPRKVSYALPLYQAKLPFAEAAERLLHFYFPYHSALLRELLRLREKFGEVFLLDCHSMPSGKTGGGAGEEPDIVLGDCRGRSAAPQFFALARRFFEDMGYSVACNAPYAGGHITAHYGRPEYGIQALQIEVSRRLYLNPHNLQATADFADLRKNMSRFSARLIAAVCADAENNGDLAALPSAAE